jgi:hypothetical protein
MKVVINIVHGITATTLTFFIAILALSCSSVSQSNQDTPPAGRAVEDVDTNAAEARPAQMFSIVLKVTKQGLEKLQVDRAENSLNRRDPHRREPTFYRVLDADGRVIFERGFRLKTEIRAETADEHGNLSGTRIKVEEPIFTIKVPAFADLEVIRLFRVEPGQTRENAKVLGEVRP